MRRTARESDSPAGAASSSPPAHRPRGRGPVPAAAIALQRAAGNRAAARVLARWINHPDQKKKGVVVPDVVAEEYTRFNPPKNE